MKGLKAVITSSVDTNMNQNCNEVLRFIHKLYYYVNLLHTDSHKQQPDQEKKKKLAHDYYKPIRVILPTYLQNSQFPQLADVEYD